MSSNTKKLAFSAMLAALVYIATMIIKIPSPLKGYINLGDCAVLLGGWLLPPFYGFLAAGIGSGLADFVSGYGIYVPATFVIKGLMAVAAYYVYAALGNKTKNTMARVISAIAAEIIMILGYFIFEGFMYGFGASIVNIPANGVQGIAGIVIGIILIKIFKKNNIKL